MSGGVREELAAAECPECGHSPFRHHLAGGCTITTYGPPEDGFQPAEHCGCDWAADDALLPVVERVVAEARAEAESVHRDLTRRLGFGDNITEPMADNDTIVRWFDERSSEANEWVESQRWRDDCYLAGHPDDEDCPEHDPILRAEARGRAEVVAKVEAALADLDRSTAGDVCMNHIRKDERRGCVAEIRAALGRQAGGGE